jgi:hypothetical protein
MSDLPNAPWVEILYEEVTEEVKKRHKAKQNIDKLAKYRDDPVGFCEDILNVEFTDEVIRVLESVRDNPVTIARSANAVGKSHGAARAALWFFSVYPKSKVFVTAAPPLENLKRILWGEIQSVIEEHDDFFGTFTMRSLKVIRSAASFIDCVSIPMSGTIEEREAKFSGKHAPQMLFIVDEGDAVPDEVYSGIESCMSGGLARMLIMFNPRASAGPVYLKERDGQANVVHLSAFNHPNVKTGKDKIPGAVDRETTVRRINQWTREMRPEEKEGEDTFQVPDFLVGEQATALDGRVYPPLPRGIRVIEDPAFSYMVMGLYPPQGKMQLISKAWIEAAQDRWKAYQALHGDIPPKDVQPVVAVDIAELGTDYNTLCRRYGGYVPRLDLWSGIDTDLSAQTALGYHKKYNSKIVYIDATGIGSSVAPAMTRMARSDNVKIRAVSVKVAGKPTPGAEAEEGEFYQLRDELWWRCREWLRDDPTAMLPPDPYLAEELATPTYSVPIQHGRIKVLGKDDIRLLLKRSPDRADALVLTFMPVMRAKVLTAQD